MSETADYTLIYESRTARQIERLAEKLQTRTISRKLLVADMRSVLTLLAQTHSRPKLHRLALQIIIALDPLPMNRGETDLWETELRFAIRISTQIDDSPTNMLMFALAQVFLRRAQFQEALDISHQMDESAQKRGKIDEVLNGLEIQFAVYNQTKQNDRARAILDTLETEISANEPMEGYSPTQKARVYVLRAVWSRQAEQRLTNAIHYIDEALHSLDDRYLEALSPDGQRAAMWRRSGALRLRGVFHWAAGNTMQAISDLETAVESLAELDDIASEAHARGNLALAYYASGSLEMAVHEVTLCIKSAELFGTYWTVAREEGTLALIRMLQGELQLAEATIERHLACAQRVQYEMESIRAVGHRGYLKTLLGEFPDAKADLRRDIRAIKPKESRCVALAFMSMCHAGLGDTRRARAAADYVVQVARQLDSKAIEIIALRVQAPFHSPADARAMLQRAHTLAVDGARKFEEAACTYALSAYETDSGKAQALVDQAAILLRACGAGAWAARIENAPRGETIRLPTIP